MTIFLLHAFTAKKYMYYNMHGWISSYVATRPICGPPLILSPALKCWGPPGRQGLCSHLAHLWATSNLVPRSEALGTPQAAGVM